MATKLFTTRTRVRYAETDASGIVYYASYLLYFELGRIEMFRELGLPYDARLPIVETLCRYRAPARFDDLLEIQSFVAEIRSKGFCIGGRVHRVGEAGELELLAEGHTAMVTTDDERHAVPLPPRFRQALAGAAAAPTV
jgi:acyl-CoA thioester hydrolase